MTLVKMEQISGARPTVRIACSALALPSLSNNSTPPFSAHGYLRSIAVALILSGFEENLVATLLDQVPYWVVPVSEASFQVFPVPAASSDSTRHPRAALHRASPNLRRPCRHTPCRSPSHGPDEVVLACHGVHVLSPVAVGVAADAISAAPAAMRLFSGAMQDAHPLCCFFEARCPC